MTSLLERIEAKIDFTDECWLWTAAKNNTGYAIIGGVPGSSAAHRVLYELVVGPVPRELDLDHLCRVRHCVNPDHLEPVTRAENLRRGTGLNSRTHCPKGHPLVEPNLCGGMNGRKCKTCKNARERERQRRLRG